MIATFESSTTTPPTTEDVEGLSVVEALSIVSSNSETATPFDTGDCDRSSIEMDSALPEKTLSDNPVDWNRRRKISCCACCGVLVGLVIFLLALLFIGAAIEARAIRRAPSTTSLYTGNDKFCVLRDDGSDEIRTFKTEVEAKASGNITHCGACGQCSNLEDMEILARTRETLTDTTTACAYRMFSGRSKVSRCMEKRVGFTPSCEDCWVDNVQCTFKACKFTCLKTKMLGDGNNNKHGGLNDCLKCDEVMCGPAFLDCSGANRRRMGIDSDIGRDQLTEQCKEVDITWETLFPADMN